MRVIVDRIEGALAVLSIYDNDEISFNIPLQYLPEGTKSGSHLTINFQLDKDSEAQTKEHVKDLLKELSSNADSNETDFKL